MPLRSLLLVLLASRPVLTKRVTVFGGTGFVGSRVCATLVEKGATVTSISKSARVPEWASDEPWTTSVNWISADLLASDPDQLASSTGSPDAVVSCVGVVGTDVEVLRRGNGLANINAFAAAKRAGVKRAVVVTVASEVADCQAAWLPALGLGFFEGYFDGKRQAEEAVADAVGGDATKWTVVKPSFIYGGDTFVLPLPGRAALPRVSYAYGSAVEELLSIPAIEALADALPKGWLIKVGLRPPSSVNAVAACCASAALGELVTGAATRRAVGTLDGTAAIKAAAGEPPSTGLNDALYRVRVALTDAAESAKARIDEMRSGR